MRRVALVMGIALVVAACGGAEASSGDGVATLSSAPSSETTVTTLEPEAAVQAFTDCMRDEGVDMEDPTVDADGNVRPGRPVGLEPGEVDDSLRQTLRAARDACAQHLEGLSLGFQNVDRTDLQDQLLELAACLREQGLDVDDPDLSSFGPGQGGRGGIFGDSVDFQDPAVQEALDTCRDLVPGLRGPGLGGGPGGPGGGPGGGA